LNQEKVLLLAEDDPNDELLVRRALEQSDVPCQVVAVRDGAAVIDYLFGTEAHTGRDPNLTPALILLDLKMPEMDGLKVLQLLHNVRPGDRTAFPPVVVFSSSDEKKDILKSYQMGAHSYIRKPIGFEQFSAAVVEVVRYWLERNEPPPIRPTPSESYSI
jgi:CheY-like chemotaxis protein